MMKRMIGVIVCIILPAIVWAQHLSGTVTDKKSGEPLFSATVGLTPESGKTVYTTTDLAGWYQFKKLLPGEYVLQVCMWVIKLIRIKSVFLPQVQW